MESGRGRGRWYRIERYQEGEGDAREEMFDFEKEKRRKKKDRLLPVIMEKIEIVIQHLVRFFVLSSEEIKISTKQMLKKEVVLSVLSTCGTESGIFYRDENEVSLGYKLYQPTEIKKKNN